MPSSTSMNEQSRNPLRVIINPRQTGNEVVKEWREDTELKATFTPIATALSGNESKIVAELNGVQGKAMDLGGYYRPEQKKISAVMRPSKILNTVFDGVG